MVTNDDVVRTLEPIADLLENPGRGRVAMLHRRIGAQRPLGGVPTR